MDSIIDHVPRIVAIYITPYSSELKSTWIGLAVTTFAILSSGSLKASYGRHFERNAIIPTVNGKLGWMSMEIISPIAASLLFAAYKIQGPSITKDGVLLVLWLLHYSNRALISVLLSPHMTNSRVDTVLMSMFFNLINGGWIGHDLGRLNAQPFVIDTRTLLGFALFLAGWITNISSDYHLQSTRRKKQDRGEYVLPDWGFYNYVVSPNYAGEIVEWIGYSLMMGTDSAWVFVLWTVCNLVPRARTNLQWYKEKFGKKVGNRTALIPGIY